MNKMLICGATSAIAAETARRFASCGAQFFLVDRSPQKLTNIASDLTAMGAAQVDTLILDLAELHRHQELIQEAVSRMGGIDIALIAHGTNSNQRACESTVAETLKELTVNFTSTISLLTLLANYFEKRRDGCIAVITSVAGDRGRKKHYVYGAAKGGVSVFLQGLRNRLADAGVSVIDLRPGFVDTPMTASVKKNFLFATPSRAGSAIHRAIQRRKDVAYVPWWWRPIMGVVTSIPEFVFKRLNI